MELLSELFSQPCVIVDVYYFEANLLCGNVFLS